MRRFASAIPLAALLLAAGCHHELAAAPDMAAEPDLATSDFATGADLEHPPLPPPTFATPKLYAAGNEPQTIALGDVDGDGALDVAVGNDYGSMGNANVLRNNGNGTLAMPVPYSVSASTLTFSTPSVALGDLNGDGKLDLAFVNFDYNSSAATVDVFTNQGGGTFAAGPSWTTLSPFTIAAGDVDGDGSRDLVVARYGGIDVYINRGNGSFAMPASYALALDDRTMAMGDLDGDGKPDLVVGNSTSATLSILMNKGDGTFTVGAPIATPKPTSVAIGDLDADGDGDIVVTSGDGVLLLFNEGGSFRGMFSIPTGTQAWRSAIGDLNGDTWPDIAVTNLSDATVSVITNLGSGTFGSADHYAVQPGVGGVAIGDLNGDGKLDIAVTNVNNGYCSILINTSP